MATELGETVYGTHESDTHVMSERVQSLASSIYKEFERMIKKYDEDVVKELMPLVVGILESLDTSFSDKQENDVELELLRDDNEQLLTQYEREKQLRKGAEQKLLEIEDAIEEEKKDLLGKTESLESIVRMLELKGKNAQDHVNRLEEKESEMKKEYNKLHERYTELFKTHMDYMERTKMLMGSDRMDMMGMSPRGRSGLILPNLRPTFPGMGIMETPTPVKSGMTPGYSTPTPTRGPDNATNLQNELKDFDNNVDPNRNVAADNRREMTDRGQMTDTKSVSSASKKPEDTSKSETEEAEDGSEKPEAADTKIEDKNSETDQSISEENAMLKTGDAENVEGAKTAVTTADDVISKPVDIRQAMSDSDFTSSLEFSMSPAGMDPMKQSSMIQSTPEAEDLDDFEKHVKKNEQSLYEELVFHDSDVIGDMDDGADITEDPETEYKTDLGSAIHPGEFASPDDDADSFAAGSDNFFGMGKEVENLIQENAELLATKNALNIVKDDLIAKVDELTSEHEILREEITSLQAVKSRFKLRITELEDEIKKLKEEIDKMNKKMNPEDDLQSSYELQNFAALEDVPMAQRKRFTRVEMARVLMERNQYKERLMELQEAVRWTEMIRASREHPELVGQGGGTKKRSTIWNFFSNLFNTSNKPSKKALPHATIRYNAPTTQVQPVGDPNKKSREKYNLGGKGKAYDFLKEEERTLGAANPEAYLSQMQSLSEKTKKERERERREQYKAVRAHVKKDDGRMQAYGWSLPAKVPHIPRSESNSGGGGSKSHVPVPVPVYCRPLLDKEPGMKIWCAAGVNITGARTRDGGSIIGASVFYSNPRDVTERKEAKNEVERLDQELKDHEKGIKDHEAEQTERMSSLVWIVTSTHSSSRVTVIDANNPGDILESFHVTSSHILCISSVPGASESDYPAGDEDLPKCKTSKDSDVLADPAVGNGAGEAGGIGGITLVKCATGSASKAGSTSTSPAGSPKLRGRRRLEVVEDLAAAAKAVTEASDNIEWNFFLDFSPEAQAGIATVSAAVQALTSASDSKEGSPDTEVEEIEMTEKPSDDSAGDPLGAVTEDKVKATVVRAKGSPASSGAGTPPGAPSSSDKRLLKEQEQTDLLKDGIAAVPMEGDMMMVEVEKMSSVMPTMWMGSQSGSLYVHSAVSQWKRCLHSVKLRDSVLSIVHIKGRVLAALADGTVAVFHRAEDGQWDLTNYHLLDLGRPHHSIRCMCVVGTKHVWCGYRNRIHVVDPQTMAVKKSFDAHPRKESQVRQLAWVGDGVWVSIRLDSTLRLYHAYTHEHLQDVDIEPYVSKMLGTGKLGFSFVRITSLLVSSSRLWIGTGNGVIISVPLSETNKVQMTPNQTGRSPGGCIRVYSDSRTDSVTPASFIPYCSMAQAQLSFHGHKDAVKFFVAVPGSEKKKCVQIEPEEGAPSRGLSSASNVPDPKKGDKPEKPLKSILVISGGEGYVDFRIGDGDDDDPAAAQEAEEKKGGLSKGDRSHLVVWQVTSAT
ncbi:C-Jun-amino-terminal kinase-interacting protein 4-like isoform X7 [Lineus longissimus]|uniref:C-Jun-amino-terminal kinase-interacting protein 4-like isoform X7 n=1 Tax=Lineus longissimus TaxID=88925 RepID=UPI00315CA464